MTLIVARRVGENIRIDSDSRLTYVYKSTNPFFDGVLKCVIFSPYLCIAYAGLVIDGTGRNIINQLFERIKNITDSNEPDITKVTQLIFSFHLKIDKETDFIVAFSGQEKKLIKISNGNLTNGLDNCWIGSKDAFNSFQEYYHADNDESVFNKMMFAFRKAINSYGRHNEVGGFQLTVGNGGGYFRYLINSSVHTRGDMHQFEGHEGIENRVGIGDIEEGSFAVVSLSSEVKEKPAIAAYFPHINKGTLFCAGLSINGINISSSTITSFIDEIYNKYNIVLHGLIYDPSKHALKYIRSDNEEIKISMRVSEGVTVKKFSEL